MIPTKFYYFLFIVALIEFLPIGHALECKVCGEDDPSCVFGHLGQTRQCENDDDQCYSWFHRTGSAIKVRRDCISTNTATYEEVKNLIHQKSNGCVKRLDGLDCFTFCSTDLCN